MAVKAMRMYSRPVAIVVAAILVVMSGLPGCETVSEHKETAIGAGAGAVGGAVIGGVAGGKAGAVIGGLLGALAGGVVGNYVERKERDRAQAASADGYRPEQGNVVRVEKVEASPTTVRPGGIVNLTSTYTILTPSGQTMTVQEIREVRHNGALVANPTVDIQRANGTFSSTLPITLPQTAQPGTYEVTTTVAMGDRISHSMTSFTVQ